MSFLKEQTYGKMNKRWQHTEEQEQQQEKPSEELVCNYETSEVDACVAISTIFVMVIYGARVHCLLLQLDIAYEANA